MDLRRKLLFHCLDRLIPSFTFTSFHPHSPITISLQPYPYFPFDQSFGWCDVRPPSNHVTVFHNDMVWIYCFLHSRWFIHSLSLSLLILLANETKKNQVIIFTERRERIGMIIINSIIEAQWQGLKLLNVFFCNSYKQWKMSMAKREGRTLTE